MVCPQDGCPLLATMAQHSAPPHLQLHLAHGAGRGQGDKAAGLARGHAGGVLHPDVAEPLFVEHLEVGLQGRKEERAGTGRKKKKR